MGPGAPWMLPLPLQLLTHGKLPIASVNVVNSGSVRPVSRAAKAVADKSRVTFFIWSTLSWLEKNKATLRIYLYRISRALCKLFIMVPYYRSSAFVKGTF